MSGGSFDYRESELNYLRVRVAEEIGYIEHCYDDEHSYNPKTIEYMKVICSDLGKLAKVMKSLDYFVSGDTCEDKFISDYEKVYNKDTNSTQ